MKIRSCCFVILLCLCFGLTACDKVDPITVPDADDIISITVTSGKESITYDDKDWITQVISDINSSKPTNKQSVQDVPQKDNYMKVGIKLDKGTTILFIYKDGESYYIEQPYHGIYEIDSELYDLICNPAN